MPDYYESTPSASPPKPAPLGLRPLATTLWCLAGLFVASAMLLAARLGVRVAEERLPATVATPLFAGKSEFTVSGSQGGPLVLAVEQRDLREYFFRESSIAGTGLEGIADGRLFEHRGSLDVRVVDVDSDLMRIEVVEGHRRGEILWMEKPSLDALKGGESATGDGDSRGD